MTEPCDEVRGVALERVRAEVHFVTARTTDDAAARAPSGPEEVGEAAQTATPAAGEAGRMLSPGDLVPVGALALLALLSGDLVVSAMAGVTAGLAVALRRLAAIRRFGFADGFVGYRDDSVWPRGVQEDDDFHWAWTPAESSPSSTPRSATR